MLIEATCNQVNQEGGYTGMTPADFRGFVEGIAARVGFAPDRLILGGDHLGPNPWKHLPPAEAMAEARSDGRRLSSQAGFTKIHLDASMGCAGEPARCPRRDHRRARGAARRCGRGGREAEASRRRSTSSAPRCRFRAARSRRSTTWR